MGNSSTKESRAPAQTENARQSGTSPTPFAGAAGTTSGPNRMPSHDGTRGPRGVFLGIGGSQDRDGVSGDTRRETKQEREARKLEKERVARAKERERSLREEGVDGGYLVTLGTYVGPEDFSKSGVRQLMIERRLAPFWRGLNDHSDSWTEHQLVAAARGLSIPAPDEIPLQEELSPTTTAQPQSQGTASLQIPVVNISTPQSVSNLSTSHPVGSSSASPSATPYSTSPLFRSRAKTMASLTTSKNNQAGDIAPQEYQLPKEPSINGQPVEAYLYKDVLECPICFLYYPPYLNKTRCCDQPICSECFVQIKRPDPHPPEHADPNAPSEEPPAEEEGLLVSEPAQCPFCVQPEFGVTYDPPSFRRGLTYALIHSASSLGRGASPTSSSSSLPNSANGSLLSQSNPPSYRRRTHSLSVNAATVVTTDRVRPDWAKKLSDARAHAARRSAAATALHTAAYLMGGQSGSSSSAFGLGRRRRLHTTDSSGSGSSRPVDDAAITNMEHLLAALEGQESARQQRRGNSDLFPGRISSRASRTEDLEEIMMMEAIRQSLAAEEERKRKEEKEAAKQAKKDEKKQAKDQRKVDKAAKKNSVSSAGTNESAFYGSSAQGFVSPIPSPEGNKGKGRAPNSQPIPNSTLVGFNPLSEPTSTLNERSPPSTVDRQISIGKGKGSPENGELQNSSPRRQLSISSSSQSSFIDSGPGSLRNANSSFNASPNASGHNLAFSAQGQDVAANATSTEPTLNFGSLDAMVDQNGGAGAITSTGSKDGRSNVHQNDLSEGTVDSPDQDNKARSFSTSGPNIVSEAPNDNALSPTESNPYDRKHFGDVGLLETEHAAAQ